MVISPKRLIEVFTDVKVLVRNLDRRLPGKVNSTTISLIVYEENFPSEGAGELEALQHVAILELLVTDQQ